MLLRPKFWDMVVQCLLERRLRLSASTMINLSIREYTLMVDLAPLVAQEALPIYLSSPIAPLPMSVAYKDEA